jgi:lipopolysaccharide transport system ATP-binding protein
MSDTVIRVENLSKKYIIRHQQAQQYTALRDVIADGVKSIGRRLSGAKQDASMGSTQEEFWALKDVSFEVKQGDRIGIIGRNGAGKSTLLKILSRIVEPTEGEITLSGRVASLLEVGTGFHPELTGRENIYLNGAILGMAKSEIRQKFDEIVDFAEIKKFLDTPVKRYSSGMYVRLAFAVAAHLEPEILIVDEVLAVGDAKFQKKCLLKIEDINYKQGRTILIVSHDIQTVTSICNKSILLEQGVVKNKGSAEEVINFYLNMGYGKAASKTWKNIDTCPGNEIVKLHLIKAINSEGENKEKFRISEPIGVQIIYEVMKEGEILWQGYNFHNLEGINLFDSHNTNTKWYGKPHPKGKFISTVWIPGNFLAEGTVIVSCAIFNHTSHIIHFHEKDAILFDVFETYEATSARGDSIGRFPGVVRPILKWENHELYN